MAAAVDPESDPQQRFEKIRDLAREHRIDLPSAASVVLGFVSLEEACSHAGPVSPPARAEPEHPADVPEREATEAKAVPGAGKRFDRAFSDAVAAGHLTARQAAERGNREAYANTLASRHKIPLEMAYAATDGRLPIHEVIRLSKLKPQAALETLGSSQPTPRSSSKVWLVPVVLGLVGGAVFAAVLGRPDEEDRVPPPPIAPMHSNVNEPPAAPAGPSTVVMNDADGRPTRISSRNPRWVLDQFCSSGSPAARMEPLELQSTVPHRKGVRRGLLRMANRPGQTLEIWIRQDPQTGDWFTGDGTSPIEPRPVS